MLIIDHIVPYDADVRPVSMLLLKDQPKAHLSGNAGGMRSLTQLVKVLGCGMELNARFYGGQRGRSGAPLSLGGDARLNASLLTEYE